MTEILDGCDHLTEVDKHELSRQLYRLNWAGPADVSADDLLRTEARVQRKSHATEVEQATKWLQDRHADGPVGSVLCAMEGDKAIGRIFPKPEVGAPPDQHNRQVLGRVKWWRETILKPRLGGESRRAGFGGPYLFRLPGQPLPPPDAVIRDARQAD
ncbi:hypothetical protein BH23PLA1_BH23PLA1_27220 [soil metagenome]